jgi:hypothetical protein
MRSSAPRWRHPELQPGWIDRPHRKVELGDFALESGEVIRNFEISYVTHGTLAPAGDNAILALTAIGSIPSPAGFPDRTGQAARSGPSLRRLRGRDRQWHDDLAKQQPEPA